MDDRKLTGKVFVVIGGTTGLGLSAARACVRQGAKVVVVGRNRYSLETAERELGDDGLAVQGDAVEPKTAEDAIDQAVDRFGDFHGLYHVAGGSGRRAGDGPLHELTDAGVNYTLDLNLKSVILSNRAAVKKLLELEHGGSVLNMSSVLGYSPSPRFFATHVYAASKAATIGFTQSCAAYYAKHAIRFNVIAPSLIATPMSQRAQEDEQTLKYITTKQPLDGGRIGDPSDADDAVVYFLSEGSKFVTGQVLAVDGGWTVSEGQIPDEELRQ